MRTLKLALSFFLISLQFSLSFGQDFSLGIVVPDEGENYSNTQSSLLSSKLENLCTKNGIISEFVPNGFVLYPTIDIFNEEVAEGGMQYVYTIKAYFSLSIRQLNGPIILSTAETISGAGLTRQKALTSLIQSINITDKEYSQFITQAKESILYYYETHCPTIIAEAEKSATLNNYEQAIAILCSIPSEAPCYNSIIQKLSTYYKKYQSQLCNSLKMEVESAIASHEYEEAAFLLSQIDPSSDCYSYAMSKFKQVESEVSKIEKRDWDFKMKQHNDNVAIEKQLIKAAGEVAKAYYSSTPTIHYTQVIK